VFKNHRGVKMVGFGRNCNSEVLLRSTWFESKIGIWQVAKARSRLRRASEVLFRDAPVFDFFMSAYNTARG